MRSSALRVVQSLARSQLVAACSTLVGHILVAPSEGLWLPFTAADGITCKKE